MFPNRIVTLAFAGMALLAIALGVAAPPNGADTDKDGESAKVKKTDSEWMKMLSREQFRVARKKGVERPFSGQFWKYKKDGIYECVCCNQPLFDSKSKLAVKTGYPCFSKLIDPDAVTLAADKTSVDCSRCDARLGRVTSNGPQAGDQQYTMNNHSLKFIPRDEFAKGAKTKDSKADHAQ